MTEFCYWCGSPASSREHVPPRNLFPKDQNKNLITVPACKAHNEDLAKLDEKFRVFIQARESSPVALEQFRTTTFRGLNRPDRPGLAASLAQGSQKVVVDGQPTIALQVDAAEQNLYFEKIIRGLYFHTFGKQAQGRVVSVSKDFIVHGLDYSQLRDVIAYLNDPNHMKKGITANPDIFRYRYVRDGDAGIEFTAIAMQFYKGVEVIGLITPHPPEEQLSSDSVMPPESAPSGGA
jgi:hypothetical protein